MSEPTALSLQNLKTVQNFLNLILLSQKKSHTTWMFITVSAFLILTIIAVNFWLSFCGNILFWPSSFCTYRKACLELFTTSSDTVLSLSLGKSLLNFDTGLEFSFSQAYRAILVFIQIFINSSFTWCRSFIIIVDIL